MIALIQVLFSILLTFLHFNQRGFSFDLSGVLGLLLVFVLFNILMIIVLLVIFAIGIYAFEKVDYHKAWKHKFVNLYSKYLFRFLYNARVIVTGKENLPKDNNFCVYSNHIEYTDPMYIMQAYGGRPMAFVAKDPLFKIPLVKNALRGLGNLPITKYADRSALETILKAIKQVKTGFPMGIFPEGKRTYENNLIEFKPGAFKLAQKAKADISPVVLFDMHKLSKKIRLVPTKIYIHILPIIKYEDYKDLETVDLAELVYNKINQQLDVFKNRG
jgi:1-acyl-sn-glycerol-3-phosphate acyltransferase